MTIEINHPTPWGPAETVTYVADGITFVSAESHGGYHLSDARLSEIPAKLLLGRFGPAASLTCPWFEEDVDWVIVAQYFPQFFPTDAQAHAQNIARFFEKVAS